MTSWKEGLSEELAQSPAFKDIGDDINVFAQNFLDNEAYKGNSIRIPSEEASTEDIAAFHTKLQSKVPGLIPTPSLEEPTTIEMFLKALGKPEAADDYDIPEVEGIETNDAQIKLIKETAHEVGMTKKQLSGFLDKMYASELTSASLTATDIESDIVSLRKEWGVTYDNRIKALTDNLLLTEAPADLTEALKNKQLGSGMTKWLAGIFEKFTTEGNDLGDNGKGDEGGDIVPVEAAERAAELRKKMMDPNTPKAGKEYESMLRRLVKYEAMAHPGSTTDINDLRAGVRSK